MMPWRPQAVPLVFYTQHIGTFHMHVSRDHISKEQIKYFVCIYSMELINEHRYL